MQKQKFTAALLSALLIATVAGTLLVNFASANPQAMAKIFWGKWNGDWIPHPQISVSGDNMTYNTTSISIQCYVNTSAAPWWWVPDGKIEVVSCWSDETLWEQFSGDNLNQPFLLNLTELSDGQHSVKVEATAFYQWRQPTEDNGVWWQSWQHIILTGASTISFTIDTLPPDVQVMANQKRTYDTTDVSLNFTVNKPVSCIGYSLNGQNVITVNSSAILSWRNFDRDEYCLSLNDLPSGTYNFTVYVWDNAGNVGASETIILTVAPFPTTLVIASVASLVAVVSVGLLVYFKKRRG